MAHITDAGTITGTVTFTWVNLGDFQTMAILKLRFNPRLGIDLADGTLYYNPTGEADAWEEIPVGGELEDGAVTFAKLETTLFDTLPLKTNHGTNWNTYYRGFGEFRTIRILTDAQIKALPTTSVELVPVPGAGKMLVPRMATLNFARTANYTNIQATAVLKIANGDGILGIAPMNESFGMVSGFLAGGGNAIVNIAPYSIVDVDSFENVNGTIAGPPEFDNRSYVIKATNAAGGAFTGGNAANTLKVTVDWSVIDV